MCILYTVRTVVCCLVPMKGSNINVNYKFSFVKMKVYYIYSTVSTVL
jgi:hypothetical protein